MNLRPDLKLFTSDDTEFLMQSNISFSSPDDQGFCYIFQYKELIGIARQELVDHVEEMYNKNDKA